MTAAEAITLTMQQIEALQCELKTLKTEEYIKAYEVAIEAKQLAVAALKEVEQYRALGTVDELKEVKEKQIPKKPLYEKKEQTGENFYLRKENYSCPLCHKILFVQNHEERKTPYYDEVQRIPQGSQMVCCSKCGQKIDWSK